MAFSRVIMIQYNPHWANQIPKKEYYIIRGIFRKFLLAVLFTCTNLSLNSMVGTEER